MPTLAGIDLSLRATAAVALPLDWGGDWTLLKTFGAGYELHREATVASHAARLQGTADKLVAFCGDVKAESVHIESPAYSMRTSQHALGELHGVVKVSLVYAGFATNVTQIMSARKLLLGKIPRKGQKEAVKAALRAAGAPMGWSDDLYDAMCVLNYALNEQGGHSFVQVKA